MGLDELIKINKKIYGFDVEPKITKLNFNYNDSCTWLYNPNPNQILFFPLGKCNVSFSVYDIDLQDWDGDEWYCNGILYVKNIIDCFGSSNIDLKSGFQFFLSKLIPDFKIVPIGQGTKILSDSNNVNYSLARDIFQIIETHFSTSCEQTIFLLEYDPEVQLW